MEERVNIAIVDATTSATTHPPDGWPASCLTPIANLPLICHVLDELAGGGISAARIVVGAEARRELERTLGGGEAWDIELSYLDAPRSPGRHELLSEIEQCLAGGPLMLYPGDCLFPGKVTAMRERFHRGDVDLVILEQAARARPPDHPHDEPASVRVSEHPLVLGPDARRAVADLLSPGANGQTLTESLLASDSRVALCELGEHWCYSNSTSALLAANRLVLDALPVPFVSGDFGDGNTVHGRVAISPAARVSNCTLSGPIAIDDAAVVEESYIGPYTAIGAGVCVSGAELDNSMVLPGAEVRYPGYRIEASIIGERASVSRSFEMPKGLHLRLGPDSRVTLS